MFTFFPHGSSAGPNTIIIIFSEKTIFHWLHFKSCHKSVYMCEGVAELFLFHSSPFFYAWTNILS